MPRLLLVVSQPEVAGPLCAQARAAFPDLTADPLVVDRLADARGLVILGRVDCVLLSTDLPDSVGVDGIATLAAGAPNVAVIALTESGARTEAIRAGAQDILAAGGAGVDVFRHVVLSAIARASAVEPPIEPAAGATPGEQSDIYAMLDGEGRVLHLSDRTRELLGITDDGLIGSSGFDSLHPADRAAAEQALLAALAEPGVRHDIRLRAATQNGTWRDLHVSVTNLLDHPSVGAVVIVGEDVTEQNRAIIAGHLEAEMLERMPAAVIVLDDAGVVVYWNAKATAMYGYQAEEALGRQIGDLDIGDPSSKANLLATVRTEGRWEGEYEARRKDGSLMPVLVTMEAVDAPEIGFRGVVATSLDNTERRALSESLAHQAMHDALTGLPNRALFVDRIGHALARLHRSPGMVAVLFIDLDRFKLINDTCGREAGDQILRSVASLFEGVLRPEDTVARLGGDEFAVCCENLTDASEAVALAERLTAAVSQPFVLRGREFYVSPSIGVVVGTGVPGETAETLLRDADAAMYHAKDRGRGRIELYDHGMRLDMVRRAELASALRHALDRDELRLHYQPLVSLVDGGLVGFEALLRWEHPEEGLLGPGEFIDIAEDTNSIVPIGAWVIGEATRQLAVWRDTMPEHPIAMSVNLSAKQISDRSLVRTVREALAAAQIEPSLLCLEITESVLMEDAEMSVATLRELKALGVELAIDDFGTGYSSLAYLKRFPVDYLKIDRSFVQGVTRETEDAVIVRAVIELGRALGLSIIAEGVETDGQASELRHLGCELAQGYRWSKPKPPEEASHQVTHWSPQIPVTVSPTLALAPDESAVLSTTEILSVLTHELATPLTVVKGQVERLGMLVGDVRAVSDVVAAVIRNADRIEHLVATLADAQELDSGTFVVRPSSFDVVELVRDVAPLALPEDRPFEIVAPPALTMEADGRRVEQILVNLLTNANKFSPANTPVVITIEGDEHDVRVSVADEGPGVPAERVGDIFRKFARLERTKKGIGLGLFLSRRLARAHGGDVHYYRREPVGSEFVLALPRHAAAGAGTAGTSI